jgi:hypothetical protein
MKLKYSGKFYWGAILVIFSLLMGQIAKLVFFFFIADNLIRWTMISAYIISWPILFLGVYWMGKEYADSLRKYFRYKFYHQHMKQGTKRVYHATKERTRNVRARAKERSNKFKEKTRERIKSKLKRNR